MVLFICGIAAAVYGTIMLVVSLVLFILIQKINADTHKLNEGIQAINQEIQQLNVEIQADLAAVSAQSDYSND